VEIQLEGIGQPGHERLLYCKKTTFQFVHQFSILKTIFPNNHSVVCVRLNKKSGLYGDFYPFYTLQKLVIKNV
jgi:hypothetical protein